MNRTAAVVLVARLPRRRPPLFRFFVPARRLVFRDFKPSFASLLGAGKVLRG